MGNKVLTDGATFKCAHMAVPIGVSPTGIAINKVAQKIRINGAAPILDGTKISGCTVLNGCTFTNPGTGNPQPCIDFSLISALAPATGKLMEGGVPVYTEADLVAIAAVTSSGNTIPGLVISESQTKLKA